MEELNIASSAVSSPLSTVIQCPFFPLPKPPSALLFTSRHAVSTVPTIYHHLPIYGVGESTKKCAKYIGFNQIISITQTVDELKIAPIHRQNLLYVRGREVTKPLHAILEAGEGTEITAYTVIRTLALPEAAKIFLKQERGIIPLFSTLQARHFLRLAAAYDPQRQCYIALSPNIQNVLREAGCHHTILTKTPDMIGMKAALKASF